MSLYNGEIPDNLDSFCICLCLGEGKKGGKGGAGGGKAEPKKASGKDAKSSGKGGKEVVVELDYGIL